MTYMLFLTQQVTFFNNYLKDPRRPRLPDPQAANKSGSNQQGGPGGAGVEQRQGGGNWGQGGQQGGGGGYGGGYNQQSGRGGFNQGK